MSKKTMDELARILKNVEVQFGLRQQGHVPRIEAMLRDGATWAQIGAEIGWDADAARDWYERFETPSALRQQIADLITEARAEIASRDATIEAKNAEIAELRAEIAKWYDDGAQAFRISVLADERDGARDQLAAANAEIEKLKAAAEYEKTNEPEVAAILDRINHSVYSRTGVGVQSLATMQNAVRVEVETLLREIEAKNAEIAEERRKRFVVKHVDRSDHSTACSIWGDDGQGGTREGFPQPLPCNCGALENFAKAQLAEAKNAEIAKVAEELRQERSLRRDDHLFIETVEAQLAAANAEIERLKADLATIQRKAQMLYAVAPDDLKAEIEKLRKSE